jgi:uncharacterized protein with HEPN domain
MASLPLSEARRIADMLDAMERIRTWIAGKSLEVVRADDLLCAALRYEFLVISEASRHLLEETKYRHPHIPSRKVANLGNVLRHAYQVIDMATLIEIAVDEFPALVTVLETEQARSASSS